MKNKPEEPKPRGFAVMSAEDTRRIARMGGEAVSRNRKHMREIGKKGGKNSHKGDFTLPHI